MNSEHSDVVILGAGISGLAAAFYAKRAGLKVTLIEDTDRPGGVIRSVWKDGFLLEYGPNTLQPTHELMELIELLGLSQDVMLADDKSPRYIQYHGVLHKIPMSPAAMLKTRLLTPAAKLRMLIEPLIPSDKSSNDESVAAFFRRRLGKELTENLVSPFVAGIWAGDPEKLSMRASFGLLFDWEKKHGSLLKGMLKSKKEKKGTVPPLPKGLLNFKNGLETLALKLGDALKSEIFYGEQIESIVPPLSPNQTPLWTIRTSERILSSDHLVFTLPAPVVAQLMKPFASGTAWALNEIPYVPMAVVHLAVGKNKVNSDLNGFGFLPAPSEKSDILGCLWNSSLFPNRAPEGQALLTILMGGAKHSEKVCLNDNLLLNKIFASLYPVLKFKDFPQVLSIYRYEAAIPQYTMGHPNRMKVFENAEQSYAGLHITGNYTRGVGVGNVIQASKNVVERIVVQSGDRNQTVREKTVLSPGLGR